MSKIKIKSIILSPSGEHGYSISPVIDHSSGTIINSHYPDGTKSDIILSIEHLKSSLPYIEWISLEIHWFSSSINARDSIIMPKVEHKDNSIPWKVSHYSRDSAKEVSKSINGELNYSGTPTDISVIELCNYLKAQGYKIMISPILMVDDENKSWHGDIKTTSKPNKIDAEINDFFNNPQYGYNIFILHYANLLKNLIDEISIGSELKKLTLTPNPHSLFPAVKQLENLSSTVKSIVGESVKITYIANYGEYHHAEGGLYPLDHLWASDNIDIVTISTLFPLTDNLKQDEITCSDIKKGWSSGEGWDYYKSGEIKIDFNDETWAWKNIPYWYNNYHLEKGQETEWNPEKQKTLNIIYSFASISEISNNPANYYNLKSPTSDLKAQLLAIAATESFLNEQDLISNAYLSYWDSRPYPYYPSQLNSWSDCDRWKFSPALNGKIEQNTIEAIGCVTIKEEL